MKFKWIDKSTELIEIHSLMYYDMLLVELEEFQDGWYIWAHRMNTMDTRSLFCDIDEAKVHIENQIEEFCKSFLEWRKTK